MTIDWTRIRTIDDLIDSENELFDEAPEFNPEDAYRLMPNLTDKEAENALFWRDFIRGIMLVTGDPGSGKDTFIHMLSYKLRKYFGRRIISDTRPRKPFGTYLLFSQEFLVDQLDRMDEVSTGVLLPPIDGEEDKRACPKPHVTADGFWMSTRGEVFLRKSVVVLNEFTRYMNKREPHLPIKRQLLRLFDWWRHLQTLIVGVGVDRDDFDRRCFPKVTCEIRCMRLSPTNLEFGITIYPLRYIKAMGELQISGQRIKRIIDASEPREGTGICEELGQLGWKDLFNTENAIGGKPIRSLRKKE